MLRTKTQRFVVVNGRNKRDRGHDPGRLLYENPEEFERWRTKTVADLLMGFLVAVVLVVLLTVYIIFTGRYESFPIIIILTPFTFVQLWLWRSTWQTVEHGTRLYEGGVETFRIYGRIVQRWLVPYDQIKKVDIKRTTVWLRSHRWLTYWSIQRKEFGEEGLRTLLSIMGGEFPEKETHPPKLVLYPSGTPPWEGGTAARRLPRPPRSDE